MRLRIGIDVGGTFTDLTAFDEDQGEVVVIRKYLSNPAQLMAVMEKITQELAQEFGENSVSLILHGSTAALNTLLEEKGVKVGLLTTRGFRDVYEIGRQWRGEEVFNFFAPAPKMLLTRDRICEIRERLDYQGEVLEPLVPEDVVQAVRKLLADSVQSIAVSFLFSYANPAHENAAARIIREIAPDLYLSFSSEVNPEWREYERTASTVANAYIGPPVSRYLHDLENLSAGSFPQARVLMMKSNGGAASAAMLSQTPIQTIMSGPVAGVIGSRYLGDVKGIEKLISLDTGGTSCDMAVIPGRPLFKSEVSVGRHPLRTHTVDIETIGAGGGSIASIQLGGVLKVGPQSAGADPGPACYDLGGTDATLTDALVVLGHLNPYALLEGAMPISSEKALEAVTRRVADPLGMSPVEAAWGILTVLSTNVMAAMRTITIERGYDPREFTLIPFGGMGPTIAGKIAPELGLGRILIPRDPGTFSAYGMLVTDVQQERSFTRITLLGQASPADLEAIYRRMEEAAMADLLREKIPRERLQALRYADMRYCGQSYEVSVPVSSLRGPEDLAELARRFHEAHHRRYGHMAGGEPIEIVNFKVTGIGVIPKPAMKTFALSSGRLPSPEEVRQVYFDSRNSLPVPVFRRSLLEPGARIEGPAVIEEKTSTTVLYPGQSARLDEYLNIEVDLEKSQ
ncbi:MAG: hydantoinase/oxoprolinase family protein [Candidatus Tectomicrobia bacterium]|uniref:Hydantoinase/oxoprolinase family protein n=1 Tax=Tectimicrobiota bacterium TaxID=2528274 RepID=A0A932GPL4_UNCTE|nr:hydantoinase/oxoprolinase family protein [Candidatus Tectomicrobia bacterium]